MCPQAVEAGNSVSRLLGGVDSGFGRGLFGRSPVAGPGAGRRMRKRDAKHGPLRRSPLHHNFTPVILNDLLHYRQAKTGPILLSLADERLKQRIPDGAGNASAIIPDLDANSTAIAANPHLPLPPTARHPPPPLQSRINE